ncbi:uncharacterized protein KY384_005785 [Bacidia gigantensis]|uniref:uncharacterized protein n=1 Tax=Bacidia gigantensis TaxID=2732470 RepID=UPI001D050A08|nr:uncharacterized protein KY384_005785 [Bacidia gigantensis]KAG8529150.1 hypothetical protein KY384_005785 [Bacidia gigantensis]
MLLKPHTSGSRNIRALCSDLSQTWSAIGRREPLRYLRASCPQARRHLFELHAGREVKHVPPDLQIEQIIPVPSEKNTHWHTTSEELIDALGPVGQEYATPKIYAQKADLSYIDAHTATNDYAQGRRAAAEGKANLELVTPSSWDAKNLLARYIRDVYPILGFIARTRASSHNAKFYDGALSVFTETRSLQWLQYRGWDITDLMSWTWILTASSADLAARRLAMISEVSTGKHKNLPVPHFLFVFLLRRQRFSARGLRDLLTYAWRSVDLASRRLLQEGGYASLSAHLDLGKPLPEKVIASPKEDPSGFQEDVFIVMIIRLLRRAREVWPAAFESITALCCKFVNGKNFQSTLAPLEYDPRLSSASTPGFGENEIPDRARLSFIYNTMLKLLAVPVSSHPFVSAVHQLRAQSTILQRMHENNPPLVVDRRGFRAVTAVQLMQKKTLKEREWAALKSKSWPPWKEDRTGIDALIGIEHGSSQANDILQKASEAGYAKEGWEDAATILAGWDTDTSPTIQTRSILVPETLDGEIDTVWVNRIKATRTLNEAWAIYLECRDNVERPDMSVYHAMLCKIVQSARVCRSSNSTKFSTSNPLPGDGTEIFEEPALPRDNVYIRSEPPTAEQFFDSMISEGRTPSKIILGLLLANATSLPMAFKVLEAGHLPRQCKEALLGGSTNFEVEAEYQFWLRQIPPVLFDSFLQGLYRHCLSSVKRHGREGPVHGQKSAPESQGLIQNPLSYAFRLMRAAKPTRAKPYEHLLFTLSRTGLIVNVDMPRAPAPLQDMLSWQMALEMLEQMSEVNAVPDAAVFIGVCKCLEKALFASAAIFTQDNPSRWSDATQRSAAQVSLKGVPLVKEMFKNCVRSTVMRQEVPPHLLQEKATLESEVEDEGSRDDSGEESISDEDSLEDKSPFLPSACLLPRLLEVPRPAHLHRFIRVLGLSCDYHGLLDLIEWMALFSDELKAHAKEQRGGLKTFRRALVATRVFLERSWVYYEIPGRENVVPIVRDVEPSPREVWEAIRHVIENMPWWGGWPRDKEVEEYVMEGHFM